MSLELDVVYKPKESNSISFLDRRKFRGQQTEREKNILELRDILEKIGIVENTVIIRELMRLDKIYQLNKELLVIVYLYMESRNFDLREIIKDFDNDFREELNKISEYGFFKKLFTKNLEYEFRQDFICYMFIINDSDLEREDISMEDLSEEIDEMDNEISIGRSLEDYEENDE